MADPTTPVDLGAWCHERAERFRDMEEHELAMYPDGRLRDAAIVEWTVRALGNPNLPGSADVVATLAGRHGAAAEIADLIRERDEARARAGRLAETLREALALWRPIPDAPPEIDATLCRHPRGGELARWRAVLAEQPTPATEPLADWERDLLTRQQIATDLDAIAGSDQLTLAWLERHRLGGKLAPSPPEVLRAVAADVAACRLHGRRERWVVVDYVGGWICAEPDPDGPDGICEMPVEDVPCTIHHPDRPRP